MSKTKKTKPASKINAKPALNNTTTWLIELAKSLRTKAERQRLICDAFEELHKAVLMPGKIGDLCSYQACHVAAWAIRNALYPVPDSKATKQQAEAWAAAYRQAIERTAAMTDRERLDDVEKHQLKL